MSSNLELWDKVERTPEHLVQKSTGTDGSEYKTVASINRIKKATEMFGTYGKRWGLRDIKHSELVIGNVVLGNLEAIFFVDADNCKTEFEISNSISVTRYVDGQFSVNSVYRKSMETDTINKALSRLGFNADIYSDEELVQPEGKERVEDLLSEADLVDIGINVKELNNDE